jgi:hypothetical protein
MRQSTTEGNDMQTVLEVSTAANNCRRAVRPGGHFAVVEMLPGEVGEQGFGEVTVTPTNTPMTILGAIAA